jgi:hypothetical protein
MSDHEEEMADAMRGLRRIVEEIDGAMTHGIWRDERGVRLKDTPEWVAAYNALSAYDAHIAQCDATAERLKAMIAARGDTP